MRIAWGWIVIGRFKSVSLLTSAHACSQACSRGQLFNLQGVMIVCEVCESIFLMFLEMKKLIGRRGLKRIKMRRREDRDFSLTLLTSVFTGPSKGGVRRGSGEAQVVSDLNLKKCRVVVVWAVFVLKNTTKPDICDVRMSYCSRKP